MTSTITRKQEMFLSRFIPFGPAASTVVSVKYNHRPGRRVWYNMSLWYEVPDLVDTAILIKLTPWRNFSCYLPGHVPNEYNVTNNWLLFVQFFKGS